jgi:ribosome-associated translation inhibitor RaiA
MVDVQVATSGRVPAGAKRSAVQKILAICRLISVPILSARVRLAQSADPAVERPATARATLDLNGRLLRAHVAAPTMREAIDVLNDRLRDQLERLAPDWESIRGTAATRQPEASRKG